MTVPEMLAELRTLAEAKQVVHHSPDFEGDKPGDIGTNSYEPNPKYAPLLNVVRTVCPCALTDTSTPHLPYEDLPATCKPCYIHGRHCEECDCAGTEYVPLSWGGLPDGALEGALKNACMSLGWFVTWDTINDQVVADVLDSESFTLAQVYAPTSVEAVLLAVTEAVRKMDELLVKMVPDSIIIIQKHRNGMEFRASISGGEQAWTDWYPIAIEAVLQAVRKETA